MLYEAAKIKKVLLIFFIIHSSLLFSWTKINALPTPRCHASLLRINQRLFLVGGFTCIRHFPDDDSSTSSVDVYDDVTESWRYVTDVAEGNYGANTVAVGKCAMDC